eukprot:GFUD01052105.1.p1 GENE.GFUD01052105.1~~GFUD01052105.1.p1  ORF type:complete len:163 (+),score=50.29 GFUD01052105.1:39-491(+)
MSNDKSFDALDADSDAWTKGDSAKIYNLLEDSYTFSGLPNMAPVDKTSFRMFWLTFRSKVENVGGPPAVSSDFMVLKNSILRELGDYVVESGNWEVRNFGRGVYMTAARNGKIQWKEITMKPWNEERETSNSDENKGKDCIRSLHTFVKK